MRHESFIESFKIRASHRGHVSVQDQINLSPVRGPGAELELALLGVKGPISDKINTFYLNFITLFIEIFMDIHKKHNYNLYMNISITVL